MKVKVEYEFDLNDARKWLEKRGIDMDRVSDERLKEVIKKHSESESPYLTILNRTQFTLFREQEDL